ncbi:MAG: energy transducer TonB [Prevotellaceae bacterium]|jgi:TonB family protein|nr:energy transducer TonB [Prevotellaceae bacterium]
MTDFMHKIESRSRLLGSFGSMSVFALLFLLLLFTYLPKVEHHSEEVIMVSFGDSFDGGGTGGDYGGSAGGAIDEGGYATQPTVEQPAVQAVTQPVAVSVNAVATQYDNQGAYAAQQAADEAARIAEEQRQKQAAIDRASRIGSALAGSEQAAKGGGTGYGAGAGAGNASGDGAGNGTGNGGGTGGGAGNGRQGNYAGRGNANVQGRTLIGALEEPPARNIEGKITVSIDVDARGVVAAATIGAPTTVSDPATRNAALATAKKARFSGGAGIVRGTITYEFKLN